MNNKFENRQSDDPNSVTTDDREVLEKENITPTDVKDAVRAKKLPKLVRN